MSLRDLCDVSYVLQVAEVERIGASDRLIVAVLRAGGVDADIPGPFDAREEFEAALVAEPEPESAVGRLRRELGVA